MDHKQLVRGFVHQLANRRRILGLTQEEVTFMMGASDGQVAKWEAGSKTPSMTSVLSWAEALNCTIKIEVRNG